MTKQYRPIVDAEAMIEAAKSAGKRNPLQLGLYIREHLRLRSTDYQYRIWACYKIDCGTKYAGCSYQSFRTYVGKLKRLGLVRVVKPGRTPWDTSWYALVPERYNSPAWNDPAAAIMKRRR